ncbi:MAG: hypothetical protein A2V79_04050 [Betaproteobacteria bacterium RBG_16_56_24]|nr:MAG: hypothetical protein A2V79_04050 [Betaproteobacteria bacterium RBG_16_56_24]
MLLRIREALKMRCLFLPHALRQMNRPERMISTGEIRQVIEYGEIIEDYPEDARGHSCLMIGWGESNRPIHIVCAHKEDYLAIITAYIPDEREWADGFKMRRKP